MKNISIVQTETLIDTITESIRVSIDREEIAMLKRAKHEAFVLLTTLTYIYQ